MLKKKYLKYFIKYLQQPVSRGARNQKNQFWLALCTFLILSTFTL